MIEFLVAYPLVLLFTVASLGYLLGKFSIKGNSLGVASVLFTGLAFGAIDPRLQIPEIIFLLGLSIFVYSIGLSSGPAFFESYRKNGARDILFTLSTLIFSGIVASILWLLFDFSAAMITGIYSGSTTNTAALAGVLDYIATTYDSDQVNDLTQQAVVGYSFSYPMGVLGGIIAIILVEKLLKIDYKKEEESLRNDYPVGGKLGSKPIKVTNAAISGMTMRDLMKEHQWNVNFGRIFHNKRWALVHWDTTFEVGDIISVVGDEEDVMKVVQELGEIANDSFYYDRSIFDVRHIFVSNSLLVGKTIASLNLGENYNATITRIRRGDVNMLAKPDTVLELGDRIRFVAHQKDLQALSAFFGDSYQEVGKVDLFSFGLGIGLGLILGSIELSFGEHFNFKLGYAGGPLIVGLMLGALRRTGPIVWSLPYSANITLQQLGLILLLACIGVRSGTAFVQSISWEGFGIFLASAGISLSTAFAILFVGYRFLRMPFSLLLGMVANQPAILDFATARSGNRLPVFGYAMMFPIALISKIIIAQILFLILSS